MGPFRLGQRARMQRRDFLAVSRIGRIRLAVRREFIVGNPRRALRRDAVAVARNRPNPQPAHETARIPARVRDRIRPIAIVQLVRQVGCDVETLVIVTTAQWNRALSSMAPRALVAGGDWSPGESN
jgi:hypothetical protein